VKVPEAWQGPSAARASASVITVRMGSLLSEVVCRRPALRYSPHREWVGLYLGRPSRPAPPAPQSRPPADKPPRRSRPPVVRGMICHLTRDGCAGRYNWAGEDFDPDVFDLDAANLRLSELKSWCSGWGWRTGFRIPGLLFPLTAPASYDRFFWKTAHRQSSCRKWKRRKRFCSAKYSSPGKAATGRRFAGFAVVSPGSRDA
jgi:hypothetical protein